MVALIALAFLIPSGDRIRMKARAVVVVSTSINGAKSSQVCRCGSNCPLGKNCGENCACAAEPQGKPEGSGWQWDSSRKCWWRVLSSTVIDGVSYTQPNQVYSQPAVYSQPSVMYSRGVSAASCST